jgi:hypothetical protein
MNRPHLGRTSALIVFLMLGLGAVSVMAQNDAAQVTPREKQTIRAEVQRPTSTAFWAVTQDFEGNFDTVDAYMAKFTEEAKRQGIPNANPTGLLVLYEDPEGKSRFRMAVGLSLTKRVEVKAPLKVERLSFSAVRHAVNGPYSRLEPVGRAFNRALSEGQTKGGRGPAMAVVKDTSAPFAVLLLHTPNRTDIILPVKRQ